MGHVEISVEFDHRTAEGFQEPHILQLKLDGLEGLAAWAQADDLVCRFLATEEDRQQEIDANRRPDVARGPCDQTKKIRDRVSRCNLPSGHRGSHCDGRTGSSWAGAEEADCA